MDKKAYTVHDVLAAEYTLQPMVCLYCGSNEAVFSQATGDARCGDCDKWQLPPEDCEDRRMKRLVIDAGLLEWFIQTICRADICGEKAEASDISPNQRQAEWEKAAAYHADVVVILRETIKDQFPEEDRI